jgi:tRNA U34 5-carboxymethylaminomethyl modifying GTPase MnmE/TrmE
VVAGFRGDLVQSLHTIVQVARLRREVHKRIIIGFVGSPSAGKDSALKALLGIDTDNINPVAGSTDVVEIYDIDRTEKRLFAINSPGLRDVRDEVSHEASRALRLIDIYVYILNAEGGLQAPELADFDLCRAAGRRTLLLLNKIDCIREKDRSRYIADLKGRLSSDVNVIACAMDPLPSLAMEPIGIDEARLELASHLAKEAKNRGQEAEWKTVIQRLGEGTSISVRKEPLAAIDLVAAKKTTHPRQVIQSPYGSPDDHLSLSVGSTRPLLRVVLLLCLSCASMALVAVLGVLILMIIYLTVVVLSVHSLLS